MREIKFLLCDWKLNIEGCNLEDQIKITYKLYKMYQIVHKVKSNAGLPAPLKLKDALWGRAVHPSVMISLQLICLLSAVDKRKQQS